MSRPTRHIRHVVAAAVLVLASPLLSLVRAEPAAADGTTVGQTFLPATADTCQGSPEFQLFPVARHDGTSYAVPAAGVLTSWSFQPGPEATRLTLRVFRPTGVAGQYAVVADGGRMRSVPSGAPLRTYSVQIPVLAGDIVGLRGTSGMCASKTGDPLDGVGYLSGPITATGTAASFNGATQYAVDVSATLEPDADGDGFGDLTQDPDTAITKTPTRPSAKHQKLKFTATVPGSTFTCRLDAKARHACTSPFVFTCLTPGKHTFTVFAKSPLGAKDATPASVRFKVRKAKGC